ncbi:MAG: GIY-YIG nuclease family protein [Candidatus Brocadia sp.]|jgi:Uri superfamily endonuclease
MDFTSDTGVYCLVVQLLQRSRIRIGRLGTFYFQAGFYVYVGSAQSSLKRRIERHQRQKKRIYWHIDYLLRYGRIVSVYMYAGEKDKECMLSHKIGAMENAAVAVKGFGSSDCSCNSHLYFFSNEPDPGIFARF